MLKKLRIAVRPGRPSASIPEGRRLYAIGDIHGRLDLLDKLLDQIDEDSDCRSPVETELIFLGDLIDRGPESAGVVERAIEIGRARPSTHFLMGNHEEVFLKVLDGDLAALKLFCRIGGRETILSYGMTDREYASLDYEELLGAVVNIVPEHHRTFLAAFEDMVLVGDYVFVHAGIRPEHPLADQRPGDLRWIRERFLDSTVQHERIVVHGHSIEEHVVMRPNRIGIDTGAYLTGRLTALGLEGSSRWAIATPATEL